MNKMTVNLVHPFKDILPDVDEFFQVSNEFGHIVSINALCDRIKKLSDKYATLIDPDTFKGDALELFTEFMIKNNATDNRVGIYDYEPITSDDFGCDGRGKGENGHPATVQVKFRSGDYILTADKDCLSNFLASSTFDEGVRNEDKQNMLIVTTAQKVAEQTLENMLKGKVRVLHRDALRKMFDNRPEWWKRFYESVKASRATVKKTDVIKLRKHQEEAIEAILKDDNQKGKIILPTGTGKTFVEAEIIYRTILDTVAKGELPIIKVNSSRILLCFQLFEEVFCYLNDRGIAARYVNFNSGKPDDTKYIAEIRKLGGIYRSIHATTNPKILSQAYEQSKIEKLPLIIFSTYNSSVKFANSGLKPHLTIHDEAHNLVSLYFHKAAKLPTNASYFFTATEKITDSNEDLGMNNTEIFDNLIYSKSPREMVEAGEMVPPEIHIVRAKSGQRIDLEKLENDPTALLNSIADAFNEHQKVIQELSYMPNEIGAKLLVVCRGQKELISMFDTKILDQFRDENPDVHVYALSSEFGLYIDGEKFAKPVTSDKKFKFLKQLKALKNPEKCIIFHVDMIGEGIDVPGITGVMPFRNCELSKFLQNLGRASRLHHDDRKRLYKGEIDPSDRTKWVKPYSWVIIPTFLQNSEGYAERYREIIQVMRSEYGYIPQQMTLIDNVVGLSEDDEIDKVNKLTKKRLKFDSGLREFEHEFELLTLEEKITVEVEIDEKVAEWNEEIDKFSERL